MIDRLRPHDLLWGLTPSGGVALREWAGDSARVLLKCATGARLIEDPWAARELAA